MNSKVINSFFNRVLIALFFIILFTPAVRMMSGDKVIFSFTEKRKLAAFPSLPEKLTQIQTFFSGTDEYFNDHFGFREWFVYRYQTEVRKRFGGTAGSAKVLRGINDWYFLTMSKLLEDYTGKNPLSEGELDNWLLSYREKKKWLESKGIHYLLVVPPDKQSVYGEFMGTPWSENQGLSRFMQLKNHLTDDDRSSMLDLAPVFIDNKDTDMLYFKSDTHWTPYGAYFAYQAMAEKIESLFPTVHFKNDFSFNKTITRTCESKTNHCGDLTRMLLDYDSFQETIRKLESFSRCATSLPFDYPLSNVNQVEIKPDYAKSCEHGKLTAVVFRDSFFGSLEPYFSENFRHVIYLWKEYDQKNIEELLLVFKPDIVIEEKLERLLFLGL